MKFKIGDKLKDKNTGEVITITNYDNYWYYSGPNEQYSDVYLNNNFKLLNPMKVNYILVYDEPNTGDPVEYFEKLTEAKLRLEQLVKEHKAVTESIKLYEVKKTGVVTGIEVKVKFE